ncbi:MAG: hypothetical protein ACYS1E_09620 [Planctomycetota bacterium]
MKSVIAPVVTRSAESSATWISSSFVDDPTAIAAARPSAETLPRPWTRAPLVCTVMRPPPGRTEARCCSPCQPSNM